MDDLCDQMINSQVWDPEENYEWFMQDYKDFERMILFGEEFLDMEFKIVRANSYVSHRLNCLFIHF